MVTEVFWFWVLLVLLIVAIFSWPSWPYTRERWVYRRPGAWRYAPAGTALLLALIVLLLFWWGLLVISWPWHTPAAYP